jgi:hypothetical protein
MNNRVRNASKQILALAVVAALGWGAYELVVRVAHWFALLRSELATAVVAASAAALVSLLSVSATKFFERRDTFEREARIKKIPGYEKIISFIFAIVQRGKPGVPAMPVEEMIRRNTDLTENVIVWGSDTVLRAFGEFRVASLQLGKDQGMPQLLITLEDLMLAIRKDLGYQNAKIKRGDVLRLFLNDLAQYQAALTGVTSSQALHPTVPPKNQ